MSEQWLIPGALAVLVLAALVLLALVLAERRRVRRELAEARSEARELRDLVTGLAAQQAPAAAAPETAAFVITDVPTTVSGEAAALARRAEDGGAPVHTGRIEGRLFADIVLRETLVKAAAVGGGVRRALAPETRNRIRFEMRREVKRSRKQRRAELREARRLLHARQRATIDPTGRLAEDSGEDAA